MKYLNYTLLLIVVIAVVLVFWDLVTNDWTYLDMWLADLQELPTYPGYGEMATVLMQGMLSALLENESAPQLYLSGPASYPVVINPAFLDWWRDNGPRIAAAENRKGFRNARGWKSSWVRDRDRIRDGD